MYTVVRVKADGEKGANSSVMRKNCVTAPKQRFALNRNIYISSVTSSVLVNCKTIWKTRRQKKTHALNTRPRCLVRGTRGVNHRESEAVAILKRKEEARMPKRKEPSEEDTRGGYTFLFYANPNSTKPQILSF